MNPRLELTTPTTALGLLLALAAPAMAQALPHNLTNGTPANANEVMDNFNLVNDKAEAAQATAAQAGTAAARLDHITVTPEGRVGFGATTPQEMLQIGSFSTIADNFIELRTIGGGPFLSQGIKMRSSSPTFGFDIIHDDSLRGLDFRRSDTGGSGVSTLYLARGNGNVGIGTNAPADRLHVAGGNIRINSPSGSLVSGLLQFGALNENGDPFYFQRESYANDGNGLILIIGNDPLPGTNNDSFSIQTRNSDGTSANQRFVFRSDGVAFKADGSTSWNVLSDRRVKHDIQPLENALDRVLALHGKTFYYDDPQTLGAGAGKRIGFIAQDVEEVFPEWVGEFEGKKSLNMFGFEALTVESLREVATQVQSLQAENEQLRQRVASLEAMAGRLADLEAALQPLLAGKR